MNIFSYIVRYDVGFAPNPFYGVCTLATCKPKIRKAASVDDWVIGTGSASRGLSGMLVFAMLVDETLAFDSYWDDERFARKRPSMRGNFKQSVGDNIYHRDVPTRRWRQEDSRHTRADGTPNPDHVARDTAVDVVLVSRRFSYFGAHGPAVPGHLRTGPDLDLVHGSSGHRHRLTEDRVRAANEWFSTLPPGCLHPPPDIRLIQLQPPPTYRRKTLVV